MTQEKLQVLIDVITDEAEANVNRFSETLGKIGKVAMVGIGATATAMVAVGKSALDAYADYEQLTGGVETLFGSSADTVMKYANEAYKTAGLSANNYMETITSFSASLLQSVGGDTEQAVSVADMAITDMADNANKMGSSIESIQNAYQGFAKQNYTMLDNLKLGYGGTKSEMERLLADAEKLSGIKYDISNLDDVYNAIHVIQTELGITGTTAQEASTTIQGSIASMKGAWENLLVGLADENANLTELVANLVESVGTVLQNILPVVEQIIMSIGDMVETLVPQILDMLPGLIENVLPGLLEASINLLVQLVQTIIDSLPMVIDIIFEAVALLVQAITESTPTLISSVVDSFFTIIDSLLNNLPALLSMVLELVVAVADAILENIPVIINNLPEVIDSVVEFLIGSIPQLVEAGVKLFTAIITDLPSIIATIVKSIPKIITSIVQAIIKLIPEMIKAGKSLLEGLATGIGQAIGSVVQKARDAAQKVLKSVKDFFGIKSPSKVFAGLGGYLMEGLANGIEKTTGLAVGSIKDASTAITDAFNPDLSIATPGFNTGDYTIGYVGDQQSMLADNQNDDFIINAINKKIDDVINAVNNKDTNVYMDTTKVSRIVNNKQKEINFYAGQSMIQGAY